MAPTVRGAQNVKSSLRIDPVTVAGLALVLMPLMTVAHEIGGHAAMCALTGSRVTAIGAFYASCSAESGHGMAARLVALAGPGLDLMIALVVYRLWQRARGDLARLVLWYLWLCCAFSAAGYAAYSGLTGIGDLGPGEGGGIGPLPWPPLWRIALTALGAFAYWRLVVLGMATLAEMIGQGPASKPARRTAAHLFYAVLCVAAVLASLPNPVGLFITLASATAASFGGKAGLISIGYATRAEDMPRPFVVERSLPLFALGVAASLVFVVVLGPTLQF